MSAQGIAAPYAEVGPRTVARMTGVVYLLFFVTAIVGEVFLQQAGVSGIHAASGDAATIARSLTAHSVAFRLGFAFGLVSVALYVAVTALFYRLFAPVSRSAVLMAAFFSLTGMAVQAVASVFQIAPLVIQAGSPYLSVFSAPQTQALGVGLVFDGLFLLLIGYLIFRSTFLPRMLGAPLALAGLGWLTYLWPPLAASLAPYIQVLGFAAEVALMLWLLIMGVNAQRWAALGCAGWRHRRVRRLNALAV